MNAYLKEIADLCEINKELTFHIARHTFATTVTLSNGVSLESVSKMLGHKSIKTTQHYAKILDKKVSEDMSGLKLVLQQKQQQAQNKKLGISRVYFFFKIRTYSLHLNLSRLILRWHQHLLANL